MKIDVLAIGELLADLVSEAYTNSLQEARSFRLFPGGSPSNVAANLQWLGKKVVLVAGVGDDGIGRFLVEELGTIGLDSAAIQVHKGYPTSIVLVSKSKGTPDFIAYRGADVQVRMPEASLLKAASIVHTTAFALSSSPAREVILTTLTRAHKEGAVVSVDWNFAPGIWGNEKGLDVFDRLLELHPLLKVSADDIERFLGHGVSIEQSKLFLEGYKARAICLTLGKDGVWYKEKGQDWQHHPALPVPEVVDITGAGDAFWAGFLAGWIEQLPPGEGVQQALGMAAQKIQQQGPLYLRSRAGE